MNLQRQNHQKLESLLRGQAYPSKFIGLEGKFFGMVNAPKVKMYGYEDMIGMYHGVVSPSEHNDRRLRGESNRIREILMREQPSDVMINVTVIEFPRSRDPKGPYIVTANYISDFKAKPDDVEHRLSAEEALSVVASNKVFYAECVSTIGNRNHGLIFYYVNGEQGFGLLDISNQSRDSPRGRAEHTISIDILRQLRLGDCLLVRKIGEYGNTHIFEPVINFLESDKIPSPNGSMVTEFKRYKQEDMIFNLPIVQVTENIRGGLIGVGYTKRPEYDTTPFYYKKTLAKGSEGDLGRYVKEASIIKNGTGVILTQKHR